MKTRVINEEGKALCMCSEEDQKILRENKEKVLFLFVDGGWTKRCNTQDTLGKNMAYKLEIQEPETHREWLDTLPKEYCELVFKRIGEAGNWKHLDDECDSLCHALGGGPVSRGHTFAWGGTPEGYSFWCGLSNGKLPPIPQAEPEPKKLEDEPWKNGLHLHVRYRDEGEGWRYASTPGGGFDYYERREDCIRCIDLEGDENGLCTHCRLPVSRHEKKEPKLVPYEQADYDDVVKVRKKMGGRPSTILEVSKARVWLGAWDEHGVHINEMPKIYEHLDGSPLMKEAGE